MSSRNLDAARWPQVRQFVAFFWGSAVGLAIDLLGFQVLVSLGTAPWLSNLTSATASIVAVYFLVTRYSFGTSATVGTFIKFVAWYGASIVVFSGLIQVASTASGLPPIVWKLLSVPVSFGLNYLFSRYLLARK